MNKKILRICSFLLNGLLIGTCCSCVFVEKGDKGDVGKTGADGKSAYELAVENGFDGTLEEWLDSLRQGNDPTEKGYVVVTDYLDINTGYDLSGQIQEIIDNNPNRTIYFPDGEYVIAYPISTSANPVHAVSLELSNFAVIKASQSWKSEEAMIRLGAAEHYNDINTNGSNYSLIGGIIDGNGIAKGVSIESGRETSVHNVSIKHTSIGLHIKKGVNGGSSDADIDTVNIVGNNKQDSIGVLVDGYDNTISNMRIASVKIGVKLNVGGNYLSNIHPLFIYGGEASYEGSIAFWDAGKNQFHSCYSDQFETGFRVHYGSIYNMCTCFWYTDRGSLQRGFWEEGQLNCSIINCKVSFNFTTVKCVFIQIDYAGGNGVIEYPWFNVEKNSDDSYLPHLIGKVLPY